MWLVARNCVLTNAERSRRHFGDNPKCNRCGCDSESIWHILRDCLVAIAVWLLLIPKGRQLNFWSMEGEAWFHANIKNDFGITYGSMEWPVVFSVVCWTLWKGRNVEIFAQNRMSHFDVVNASLFWAKECSRAMDSLCSKETTQRSQGKLSNWKPPPEGWFKINTDGAVRRDNYNATTGGIIRGHLGDWKAGFIRNIGNCSILHVELWDAVEGLRLAWNLGFRKIILELDSKEVVEILSNPTQDEYGSGLVKEAWDLLQREWEVSFRSIPREDNGSVDLLAKLGLSVEMGVQSLADPPISLLPLLAEESSDNCLL